MLFVVMRSGGPDPGKEPSLLVCAMDSTELRGPREGCQDFDVGIEVLWNDCHPQGRYGFSTMYDSANGDND